MPKGIIHHLHNPAGMKMDLIYELMLDERVYINTENNILKIFLTEDKIEKNYVKVTKLIKEIGLEKVKKKVD